jgi:hypothetical protein
MSEINEDSAPHFDPNVGIEDERAFVKLRTDDYVSYQSFLDSNLSTDGMRTVSGSDRKAWIDAKLAEYEKTGNFPARTGK